MSKDSLISSILEHYDLVDYLSKRGHYPVRDQGNRLAYTCPIHGPETNPSFYVFLHKEYPYYHCFGCLDENEPIWTEKGLTPIKDVSIGDFVFTHRGSFEKVIAKRNKNDDHNILSITTGNFRVPLRLTEDHDCLAIKKNPFIQTFPIEKRSFPYMDKRYGKELGIFKWKNIKFNSRTNNRSESNFTQEKIYNIAFEKYEAKDLEIGDFIGFPIINSNERIEKPLFDDDCIKKYIFKPRTKRITHLPVNKSVAYFYGRYLATGSFDGKCVKISLSLSEINKCYFLQDVIKTTFGLKSRLVKYNKKNTCELHISKKDLGDQLIRWFGYGAFNKLIPTEVIRWPKKYQQALLQGYKEGYGDGVRFCSTVSDSLVLGIYCLAIQAGEIPSVSFKYGYLGSDGTYHSSYWMVSFKMLESINGFRETIDGCDYHLTPITSIVKGKSSKVIDISVKNSETFVTKLGAVHNCKAHGDVINLVAEFDNCSLEKAIAKLAQGADISQSDQLKPLVDGLEHSRKSEDIEESVKKLISMISRACYHYLNAVDFDKEEVEFMDQFYQKIDKLGTAMDVESLREIYSRLPDELLAARMKKFQERQEKKYKTANGSQ